MKDNAETDVDCGGGTCLGCGEGKGCKVPADCLSGACTAGKCSAPLPTCTDGKKNGAETDVDCGSTCPKCGDGKACAMPTDCKSGTCTGGVCGSSGSCTDQMMNGNETDVDCGGSCATKCAVGKHCAIAADCVSTNCTGGTCADGVSCSDGMKNGPETDVDCGGTCPKCGNAKSCLVNQDCQSGTCNNGVCASGGTLTCWEGVQCVNKCMLQACKDQCTNSIGTANGGALYMALGMCLFGNACPSANGGVCDASSPTYNGATCANCLTKAQGAGGACYNAVMNCQNDK
jgi:hypothetical protein